MIQGSLEHGSTGVKSSDIPAYGTARLHKIIDCYYSNQPLTLTAIKYEMIDR